MDYRLINSLLMGTILEPLAHPKPGAVTRCLSHPDKNVIDYVLSSNYIRNSCYASLSGECRGFMARGLRQYLAFVRRRGNIQVGTLLLILPICRATRHTNTFPKILKIASRIVKECDSPESGYFYYRLLEESRVSHLGYYEGPTPGVGSGSYPDGLLEALLSARWDYVHRELLDGYLITQRAVSILRKHLDEGWENAILWGTLELLSEFSDTLIAHKWGWRSFKKALLEARVAKSIASRHGIVEAMKFLDNLWRPRGWSPGSILDIIAVSAGIVLAIEDEILVEG